MNIVRSLPAPRHSSIRLRLIQRQEWMRVAASCALAMQLACTPFSAATPASASKTSTVKVEVAVDPVLKVMQSELSRATTSLAKSEPAPYFMSYTVNDQSLIVLVGSYGSLLTDAALQRR